MDPPGGAAGQGDAVGEAVRRSETDVQDTPPPFSARHPLSVIARLPEYRSPPFGGIDLLSVDDLKSLTIISFLLSNRRTDRHGRKIHRQTGLLQSAARIPELHKLCATGLDPGHGLRDRRSANLGQSVDAGPNKKERCPESSRQHLADYKWIARRHRLGGQRHQRPCPGPALGRRESTIRGNRKRSPSLPFG